MAVRGLWRRQRGPAMRGSAKLADCDDALLDEFFCLAAGVELHLAGVFQAADDVDDFLLLLPRPPTA